MAELKELSQAIIDGNQNKAAELTKSALQEGKEAKTVLDGGLVAGMQVVGERFKKNEIFIPEVLMAARAMKSAVALLEPELIKAGVKMRGTLVIGSSPGDLHDIGKNLVTIMMKGAGFNVIDLGTDVAPEEFLKHAKEANAELVGISSLLTTTMPGMEKTVKTIRQAGLSTKVMIGGAPVTQDFADRIGADGYAPDAASAVDMAKSLIS